MELGLVGLGKMGGGMLTLLSRRGFRVVGHDRNPEALSRAAAEAGAAASLEELVRLLQPPRQIWLMIPHGPPTAATLESLRRLLQPGDPLVDGGNSHYVDTLQEARKCDDRGIWFLDVGTSGGIWGLENGFNLMVGGTPEAFRRMEPVLAALAAPGGYAHVGPVGSGHFVKMVHNGLEYAMLEGMGEAFECLRRSEFSLDLKQIAELWLRGSVVRSWLLELLVKALGKEGPELAGVETRVEDSGMGRWMARYAIENGIPLPAITLSLFERFSSQEGSDFARKVIAALRNQFGGHK